MPNQVACTLNGNGIHCNVMVKYIPMRNAHRLYSMYFLGVRALRPEHLLFLFGFFFLGVRALRPEHLLFLFGFFFFRCSGTPPGTPLIFV